MANKYALIIFIDGEEDKTVSTKTVITNHNCDTLNCRDWDADNEIQMRQQTESE